MLFMCQLAGFNKAKIDALTRKIFNCYHYDQSSMQDDSTACAKSKKIKTGKNSPCSCGSGLKYKKCYGKNYQPRGSTN